MIEMLVCLIVISLLTLVTLNQTNSINLDHYYFLNEYLSLQSQAMLNKTNESFNSGVRINSMGKVNQARTIEFGKHKVIIHLGNGYATYE